MYRESAAAFGIASDDGLAFGHWLAALADAEGDSAVVEAAGTAGDRGGAGDVIVHRTGWRLMRGIRYLSPSILDGWNGLIEGAQSVHNRFLTVQLVQRPDWGDAGLSWRIRRMGLPGGLSVT
jgi:hypothetical protein